MRLTLQPRVRAVAAIESNPLPINKLAGSRRRNPHGVMVVNHPRAALADPARTVVKPNGNPFLRDVARRDLIGPKERRAEVHALIRRGSCPNSSVANHREN